MRELSFKEAYAQGQWLLQAKEKELQAARKRLEIAQELPGYVEQEIMRLEGEISRLREFVGEPSV